MAPVVISLWGAVLLGQYILKTFTQQLFLIYIKLSQNVSLLHSLCVLSGQDPRGPPHSHPPHFTDKETKAKKVKRTCRTATLLLNGPVGMGA